jgi:hypothetical protein
LSKEPPVTCRAPLPRELARPVVPAVPRSPRRTPHVAPTSGSIKRVPRARRADTRGSPSQACRGTVTMAH